MTPSENPALELSHLHTDAHPVSDPDWVAVHTVIKEDAFWDIIEQLRAAGASEILVTPIEKLLL